METQSILNILIPALQEIHTLSDEFRQLIPANLSYRLVSQDQLMVYPRGKQNVLWYIKKGFGREYYDDEIRRRHETSWFWFDGDFVFHSGYFYGSQSDVYIEFYSDTELFEFDLLNLQQQHQAPEADQLAMAFLGRSYIDRKQHYVKLEHHSHQENVNWFHHEHSKLFNIAAQEDIASFLHIRDKNLSRYTRNIL